SFMSSFAAMLPLHVGCILGFPIGIWALATLMREDVRLAFAVKRRQRTANIGKGDYPSETDLYDAPRSASTGRVAVIVIAVIFLALLAILLLAAMALGIV